MKDDPKSLDYLKALKRARREIKSGLEDYICNALPKRFRPRIMAQLDGEISYGAWIRVYHPKAWERMLSREDLREGRVQWLDHMIREENNRLYDLLSRWDRLGGLIMPPSAYGLTDYPKEQA